MLSFSRRCSPWRLPLRASLRERVETVYQQQVSEPGWIQAGESWRNQLSSAARRNGQGAAGAPGNTAPGLLSHHSPPIMFTHSVMLRAPVGQGGCGGGPWGGPWGAAAGNDAPVEIHPDRVRPPPNAPARASSGRRLILGNITGRGANDRLGDEKNVFGHPTTPYDGASNAITPVFVLPTPQLYLWLYGGGPGQGAAQPVPT
ncbi:unnamed protein product [Gadus morhua 'NCC']